MVGGGTTAFDVTWNEPDPPTSGTYSLLFKGAATDGSDDAIFRVATMSDSNSIATGSWEKVGAQATFTSGCEIDLDYSAAGVSQGFTDHSAATDPHGDRAFATSAVATHAAAADQHADRAFATAAVATHEADTSSVHGITDTAQIALKNAANTFTLGQLFPDGSASSNALARSADVTTGINFAANTVAIAAAGTNRFSVSSTIVTTTIPVRTSNGTAGAPSHSFTAQSVTGMYAAGSNTVGFSTNSTLRLSINTARARFTLPIELATGALALGQLVISGGGTTTNIATTDPSRLVVDTTGAGETLQWYATSSAQEGATYLVIDAYNNAAANNIVIKDNGGTTIGTIATNGGWALVSIDFTNGVINCKVLA